MEYLKQAYIQLERELKIIGATIESKDQRIKELEERLEVSEANLEHYRNLCIDLEADLLKRRGRGDM